MNSYNKQALDIIAKEQGFIRDNLEKVISADSFATLACT